MDFKTLWKGYILRENQVLKGKKKNKMFKDKTPVQGSIYNDKTLGEAWKREHILHHVLKYKLLIPAVWILRKVVGKKLDEPIPDLPYNKNFKIADAAFEKACRDWIGKYTCAKTCSKMTEEEKKDYIEKNVTAPMGSADIVRNFWKIGKYGCMNDSVYRELFNMWIYEIGIGMAKEYKDKEVIHPLYNSSEVFHPNYIQVWHQIETMDQMNKKPLIEQERWVLQKLADNDKERNTLLKDLDLIRFKLERDLVEDVGALKKELKLHLEKVKEVQEYQNKRNQELGKVEVKQ